MGALHAGHAALFRRRAAAIATRSSRASSSTRRSSATRPTSPRTRAISTRDAAIAEEDGVDVLFAPDAAEMYPPGFATWVVPEGVAEGLEGAHRPGHFRGVATVCLKLFNIVRPQRAWFGRKDAQQVAVLKQLVRDLNLDVEIRVVDTVRDADGLALSSRNARLSADERARALAIPRALATRDADAARAVLTAAGIAPDTSRSPTSTAPPSRSPPASARPA